MIFNIVGGRGMKQMMVGLLFALLMSAPCVAAEITETLPGGMKVTADYRAVAEGAPSVVVLHGFLVTRSFPIVQTLLAELSAGGYNVLAPTLSLGMSYRRSGLACDAVHTHTHEDDLAEAAFWVGWLARRTSGPIVLVGHSFGSAQWLGYLAQGPHPRVAGLIGMSMSYVGASGERLDPREIELAERRLGEGDLSLGRYHLIYCHGNYTSTPRGYLSYARAQRNEVLTWARASSLPRVAIMGGDDQRFGADWVQDMQRVGVQVQVISGASHFFDGTFEFDLLDAVNRALIDMKVVP